MTKQTETKVAARWAADNRTVLRIQNDIKQEKRRKEKKRKEKNYNYLVWRSEKSNWPSWIEVGFGR